MGVDQWLERYRVAWETGDSEAAAALFTEDATYRSSPFREPHRGQEGVREYWSGATGSQSETRVRFGRPIGDAHRTAVEWWATMRDEDGEITLPGILVLRFASDGREPHPGWGD